MQKIGHSRLSIVIRKGKRSAFLFVLFLLFFPAFVFAVQNNLIINADIYNIEDSSFISYGGSAYFWFGMDDSVAGADYPDCNPALELCIHSDGLGGNKVNLLVWDNNIDSNFYFAIYSNSNVDGSLQKWKLDIDSSSGVVRLWIDGVLQSPTYVQNNFSEIDFTGINFEPYYSNGGAVYESLVFAFVGLDLSGIDFSVLYVLQLATVIVTAIAGIWAVRKLVKIGNRS